MKFESTDAFKNVQKEMTEHNNKIVKLKEDKEVIIKESIKIETNIEATNKGCENRLGITPTPTQGSYSAKRKAMQNHT